MPSKSRHVFISVEDDARESRLTIKGDLELLRDFLSTFGRAREPSERESREPVRAKGENGS